MTGGQVTSTALIQLDSKRANLMRYDTAVILKRFYFCERQIAIAEAGWIAGTAPLLLKIGYAQLMWEDAQAADAMRARVFELRYPSRLLEKGDEEPLITFLDEIRHAPNALALYLTLVDLLKPALRDAYQAYLDLADNIGDGPSMRFMQSALRDKEDQIARLTAFRGDMLNVSEDERRTAFDWLAEAKAMLDNLGGIGLDKVETPPSPDPIQLRGKRPFSVAQVPAREAAYANVRFYWPDIIVEDYAYGEGLMLQLRSAISHINEVWAIEACSHFTYAFADLLPWEFFVDATRWTYDEARHCRMGYERLRDWGYEKHEIPLGTYIYDAAKDEDPIYRLGMLYFFETKNIGKKPKRRDKFLEYGDSLSQHDMDFDWADETIHANYGNHWLSVVQKTRGEAADPNQVRDHCHALVDTIVATATDEEREQVLALAQNMVDKAQVIIGTSAIS
ncbi:MAG: DUF455 family protein [Chloroflexota bacterium]